MPLLLLLLLPLLYGATATATIPLGSSLTASSSSSWLSNNSSFEFRFYAAPDSDGFSAGILFHIDGMPHTPAWSAGPDAVVSISASFNLSSSGDLLLLPSASSPPSAALWRSSTANSGVDHALLRDDGNLVLLNASGHELWQSYLTPSHTLLQNQQLLAGGAALTNGAYRTAMTTTGNLTLSYTAGAATTDYWYSNTPGGSYAVLRQTSDSVALGVYNATNGTVAVWYPSDYTPLSNDQQIYRRVKLDDDGNLRIYSWTAGNVDWSVGWQALEDQCLVYGYCGPNGICAYTGDGGGTACTCAVDAGFGFVDPAAPRAGCTARSDDNGHSCSNGSSATMVPLNHTQLFLPSSLSTTRSYRYGSSKCSLECLSNQLCSAATSLNDGSGTCLWLVSDAIANFSGYQSPANTATSYLKFCGRAADGTISLSSPQPSKRSSRSVVIAGVVAALVTLAVVVVVQAVLWVSCRRRRHSFSSAAQYAMLEYASGAPVQVSYKELRRATEGFKHKLGEGGFGSVYRGELAAADGGVTEVAVKRLEGLLPAAPPAERQFRMEVAIIGSTHHMNLVRLCGFCAEGNHRLLVYEFMKNGSLDRYLFGGNGSDDGGAVPFTPLDWNLRYSILLGAARGLTYLHQECRDCIIHCDIKPENILLDDYFTAKLSDFGLAKLLSAAAVRRGGGAAASMLVRGTRGYMAPEWRSNLPITVKSDVYAFGMVVLETVSGRRSFEDATTPLPPPNRKQMSFMEWAYHEYFRNGRAEGVVDARVWGGDPTDMEEVDRALKVAFWCMQVQPSARPSMSRVIQMLEGAVVAETPPMPVSFGEPFTNEEADLCRAEVSNGGVRAVSASATSASSSSPPFSASSSDRHHSVGVHHQSLIGRFQTGPATQPDGLKSV